MPTEQLFFNGINGATGEYLLPPMTAEDVSKIARGETFEEAHVLELKSWYARTHEKCLGPKEGVDPKDLAQSGWGVIFAFEDQDRTPALKEALQELLDLRKEQTGKYYREYTGEHAYRPGESKPAFLARHGIGPGPADPEKVPYYLLLVGDPEKIPYRFQYQLDVQYAVGRIHFRTLEEYAQYARSVVMAEKGKVVLPRRATFFGVQNPDDRATELSATKLVADLAGSLAKDQKNKGWNIETVAPNEAMRDKLARLMGGAETPSLLFTASHGMGFPNGDPRQLSHHGALLSWDPDQPIPAGTPIPVPDPGMAPLVAARLAAETMIVPGLFDPERVALIRSLVPVAAANPSALDTVLARLLLVERPADPEILGRLADLAPMPKDGPEESLKGELTIVPP